jgi:glycosylphosphatidylinositol deacylase
MGGIVTRSAMSSGVRNLVDSIITMSTPHIYPPVPLHWDMEGIYNSLPSQNASSPLLVSLCGGISDTQIVSDSCAVALSKSDGFTVFTTGISGVWTGVDHQAMVWCHQVRWKVARAILESTAVTRRDERLAIYQQWFLGPMDNPSANFTSIMKPEQSHVRLGNPGSPIPWLADPHSPFPSVGEGVKPNEIAHVIQFVEEPVSVSIQYGHRVRGTAAGRSWSKLVNGHC